MTVIAITGNLTKTPELKFSNGGQAMLNISVAVERYLGKEKPKETDFYEVKIFGNIAENVNDSLGKGDRVNVIGQLRQDRWEKDGVKHEKMVLYVDAIGPDLKWATAIPSKVE